MTVFDWLASGSAAILLLMGLFRIRAWFRKQVETDERLVHIYDSAPPELVEKFRSRMGWSRDEMRERVETARHNLKVLKS